MVKSGTAADMAPEECGILSREAGASIAYRRRAGHDDRPGIVFLTGFQSAMTGVKAAALDAWAAGEGRQFTRFDYSGHGASSGSIETGTIGTWLGDAIDVLDRLTSGPQILVGSSMGGWLAILAALARPERVCAIVGIAAAADFTERLVWDRLTEDQRRTLIEASRLRVPSAYDPAGYLLTRDLIEEGRRHLVLDAPIPLSIPIRLLHGMADRDVPWRHALSLAEAFATDDVVLTLIKDGDHRLSRPRDLVIMIETIAALDGAAIP